VTVRAQQQALAPRPELVLRVMVTTGLQGGEHQREWGSGEAPVFRVNLGNRTCSWKRCPNQLLLLSYRVLTAWR